MDAIYHSQPDLPPPPDAFNMAAYVLSGGSGTPDKLALSVLGEARDDWTYARLTRAVRAIAGGLLAQGLVPGDRVKGPAIIVEDDTSTVISPTFDATINALGYIMLERKNVEQSS